MVEQIEIKLEDIVQITNEAHHWYPCLVVVSELKSFGIQGYAMIPHNDEKPTGNVYIRLGSSEYEFVGHAIIVVGEEDG